MFAAAAALTAACGSETEPDSEARAGSAASASSGAPSATGGGAPSGSPGGGRASTEEVCKAVLAIFENEKLEVLNVAFELMTAEKDNDQAAMAKAREHADALNARLAKAVNAETEKAADPKLRAAIDGFVAVVAKLLTSQAVLDDPDIEKKLDEAANEAAAYCPALKN
ncbi:hypothetical protein [Dactylosporangium sp. NPDC051484]|uniref:hypothetical protein n=1 Tax=Dactylosporangium sp. NPDC051484 TaxID=3154942 RepID=UPI0034506E43